MNNQKEILVSVCVLVYNFEKYIKQCIESILEQETDFEYEIIIGEDCSSDSSRTICEQFQKEYPERIHLIANEHNFGLMRNLDNLLHHAHGQFIAICAGDDYWCDSMKLAKQAEFLQSHQDYGVIFTAGYTLCSKKITVHSAAMTPYHNGDMKEECFNATVGYASSVMYRKTLLQYVDFEDFIAHGIGFEDYVMYAIFSLHTNFAFLEDKTMVYRIVKSSISHSALNVKYSESWANTRRYLQIKYPKLCHYDMDMVDDIVNYTKLKRAIYDGKYNESLTIKKQFKTSTYKSKKYTKALNGRISFELLRLQMVLRMIIN